MTPVSEQRDPDTVCLPCKSGFHNECDLSWTLVLEDDDECCCQGAFSVQLYLELDAAVEKILAEGGELTAGGSKVKDPDEIKDWESTGRKRAKEIAVVFEGDVCAWAFLKFAGGGVTPIVGCNGNRIYANPEDKSLRGDRHHGPDKNVLNNSLGVNLHLICTFCHNRWHALNDPFYALDPITKKAVRPRPGLHYNPDAPYWPHDPVTRATELEYEQSEAWWALGKASRPEYPFTPAVPPALPAETKEEDDGRTDG